MEFYIVNGIIKKYNNTPRSQVGISNFTSIVKSILTRLGVAFKDPCCPLVQSNTSPSLDALKEFATNAAALAGGLVVGNYYKTTTTGTVVIKQVV